MQQNNEFNFAMNGPVLNVRKVEDFDGLVAGPYCRIFVALNGLWCAELQSETDQNHDEYFTKTLDAAKISICATVYECVDLDVVEISSQIGKNRVVVTTNNIYAFGITGTLHPTQIFDTPSRPQALGCLPTSYRPVDPPMHYTPNPAQYLIIPGVSYSGVFTDNSGFVHWTPSDMPGYGYVGAAPVINPMFPFEYRMMLESVLRSMIQNQHRTCGLGVASPIRGYSSDGSEQRGFNPQSSDVMDKPGFVKAGDLTPRQR